MKLFVTALLTLSFPMAAHATPAKSNIDSRGVAALDKAVAYYKKPRSFSLSATQKAIYDGKTTRNARLQISLQAPYRASLRTTLLDEKGRTIETDAVRLMDAKSLYLSQSGVWPSVRAIGVARDAREDGLKEILGDTAGVALAVVVMSLGHNPASDPDIKSVRYGEIRENGKILNGTIQGLSASWKGRDEYGEAVSGALNFERAGRLRLAQTNTIEPLIVLDGKTRWSLGQAEDVDEKGRRTYSRFEADPNEIYIEIQTADEPIETLGGLLSHGTPLDAEEVAMNVKISQMQQFHATLLAPQSLNGQLCDLVRLSETSASDKKGANYVKQKTYWFARSDGSLMRLQYKITIGKKEESRADWQITEQNFNPKFAPDTFKFTPPKGAVLAQD